MVHGDDGMIFTWAKAQESQLALSDTNHLKNCLILRELSEFIKGNSGPGEMAQPLRAVGIEGGAIFKMKKTMHVERWGGHGREDRNRTLPTTGYYNGTLCLLFSNTNGMQCEGSLRFTT